MRRFLVGLTLLAGFTFASTARADSFDFSLAGAGGGFSGSGTLDVSEIGSTGAYTITGITGTGVTGLISPLHFGLNDNLLYPNLKNILDPLGFSFMDDNSQGDFDVNIFEVNHAFFAYLKDEDGFKETIPISFSLSPSAAVTPEPSSFLLLGTGLIGMIVLLRRRAFIG